MLKKIYLLLFIFVFILFSFCNYAKEDSLVYIYTKNNVELQVLSVDGPTEFIERNTDRKYYEIISPSSIFYKKTQLQVKALSGGELELYFSAPVFKGAEDLVEASSQVIEKQYDVTSKFKSIKIKVNDNLLIDKPLSRKTTNTEPYIRKISVNSGDVLNISYKQKLHLGHDDINNYLKVFLLFVVITGFLLVPQAKRCDLLEIVVSSYKKINPLYIKSFWTIFAVLFIVFFFNIINLMHGNHDWYFLAKSLHLNTDVPMGRYGAHLIKNILFDGMYIPVLTYAASFAGLSLTAVLLNIYWKLPKKFYTYLICGLILVIQPFTLEWMYYVNSLPDFFFAPLFVILAFMSAEKSLNYIRYNKSYVKFISLNLFSIILLNFSLSIYPSLINTVAVIFLGKLFIDFLDWDGTKPDFKNIIGKFVPAVFDVLTAGIIYRIVVFILAKTGILIDIYTIKSIHLQDLPLRVLECIKMSCVQLYSYQFPFMPNYITEMFTILLIILVMALFVRNNSNIRTRSILIIIVQLLLLFSVLISTKTATMISEMPQYLAPRIDFFGLLYFRVLIIAVLFMVIKYEKPIKNIVLTIVAVILFSSVVNDLNAQKVWQLGLESEKMLWNRMIARIEANANFDESKKYNFFLIGRNNISIRAKYYPNMLKTIVSYGLLKHSYNPDWIPFQAQEFYYPNNFIRNRYSIFNENDDYYKEVLSKLYNSGELQNMKAWPAEQSIFINDDIIVFVTDQKALINLIDNLKKGKVQ